MRLDAHSRRTPHRAFPNRAFLALAGVIIALLAMVPFGPAASAQDSAGQLEQLKNKNRDLDNKVANEDKNIVEAEASIASIEREVQKALRRSLLKYKLHTDQDLFDRAYGYIRQYY